MKGLVFAEFLEMVEDKFDYKMVDDILSMEDLPSNGIYSSVGTYSYKEMYTLVGNLHKKTEIPISELLIAFGEYLFVSLMKSYGEIFSTITSAFEMFIMIENHIHVEVRKLYPEAELPTFDTRINDKGVLTMDYNSERKLSDLALGLIKGCLVHFNETASIERQQLNESGTKVRFTITKT